MNAAETIQAAIDRLEAQRTESDEGDNKWSWHAQECGIGRLRQSDIIDEVGGVVVEHTWTPDAALIVTLHRTIDAQLVILRFGLRHNIVLNEALELARAILGGDS